MADRVRQQPVDYETLAEFLKALAYPARLELLSILRFPHTVSEIELTPHRSDRGENPARPAARQTVQKHLNKLVETDLVRAEPVTHGGREVSRYHVNPLQVYALMEELRRLSTMYAGRGLPGEGTDTLGATPQGAGVEGPRFTLVHGLYEGKAFPLDRSTADGEDTWRIGRERGLAVSLDYDPFVSFENALVVGERDGFLLEDLGSKNGTSVNWAYLDPGGTHQLAAGDIVGVGRSLLCFLPE